MSKPMLILVVDDDEVVRDVLCSFLKKMGHLTVGLPDGQSAISYAEQNKPDLVLLDIKMPGLSGIETCYKLKRMLQFSPPMGIIIITAYDSYENLEKSNWLGAIDLIKKPFDLSDVNQRINAWYDVRNIENEVVRMRLYSEKID